MPPSNWTANRHAEMAPLIDGLGYDWAIGQGGNALASYWNGPDLNLASNDRDYRLDGTVLEGRRATPAQFFHDQDCQLHPRFDARG